MRIFRIPIRVTGFEKKDIGVFNHIFNYINSALNNRIQSENVTYSTNMNTDVAGEQGDIVFCSTDTKFYGCTTSGAAGSAVWVAFN